MSGPLNLGPSPFLLNAPCFYLFSALLRNIYYLNNNQQSFLLHSCGPFAFYQSTLTNPEIPDWSCVTYQGWQVLTFAGTANVDQWLLNVLGTAQTHVVPYPGQVQTYFSQTANTIWANIQSVLGSAWPLTNCVCVGHSLGGAIADFISWRLNLLTPGSCPWVYTEGCPRTGNLEWALSPAYPIFSLRNSGDLVPLVPPQRGSLPVWVSDTLTYGPCQDYYPVGGLWEISPTGRIYPMRLSSIAQPEGALVSQLYNQGLTINAISHAAPQYAQRLAYWAARQMGGQLGVQQGINLDTVNIFQQNFGNVDGFNWTVPEGFAGAP